jgi:riboflavin kinase / FMN adenylyltransferase
MWTARYDGVANLGIRPMYEAPEPLLETFLLDFSGDLYDRHVAVELIAYLRPEAKFPSVEALKTQMAADVRQSRQVLRG